MLKILLAAAALALATTPVRAQSLPSFYDNNSAAFSDWPTVAVGATITGARSLGAICTVSGVVTVQSANGSTLAWPVTPGWQTLPFAVVQITASTATCTFFNLK